MSASSHPARAYRLNAYRVKSADSVPRASSPAVNLAASPAVYGCSPHPLVWPRFGGGRDPCPASRTGPASHPSTIPRMEQEYFFITAQVIITHSTALCSGLASRNFAILLRMALNRSLNRLPPFFLRRSQSLRQPRVFPFVFSWCGVASLGARGSGDQQTFGPAGDLLGLFLDLLRFFGRLSCGEPSAWTTPPYRCF